MSWISVKDKMPPSNGVYWAYPTAHTKGYAAMYWNGSVFSTGRMVKPLATEGDSQRIRRAHDVTHWAEIELLYPEPPKE